MLSAIAKKMQNLAEPFGEDRFSSVIRVHPSNEPALMMLHISHIAQRTPCRILKSISFLYTTGRLQIDVYPKNATNPIAAVKIKKSAISRILRNA